MLTSPAKQRSKLYSLLGDLPLRNRKIHCKKISESKHQHFILEKLSLDLNGIEKVPAYFIRPGHILGKYPVILYHHTHGGRFTVGKDEVLSGAPYLFKTSYAGDLAKQGYAVLAIDNWNFGQRHQGGESALFKEMLWNGKVLWGMMVYDNLRALDYLCSRNDVDNTRIATLGMSMGSTLAWWIAALDTRIKVCVDICCLTDFQSLIDNKGLDFHGLYYFVPGLLKHFDTASINTLISPRAHLSLAGELDKLTPPKGLIKIDNALRKVYRQQKNPKAWKLNHYPVAHHESIDMRKDILQFLGKWL